MNKTAYFTTDLAIKTLSKILKAKTVFHGLGNIPDGPIIFVVNHFTRLETLLLPYYFYHLTKTPIRSLADAGLFKGGLKSYFDMVGVVSTKDPQRDKLILGNLLTGRAHWIIFPEGRMVKTKKIIRKGKYVIGDDHSARSPHTGAASLSLRAEIFRLFLTRDEDRQSKEGEALRDFLGIGSDENISADSMKIVPVNLTYYPIRAHDNLLTDLMTRYVKDPSDRMIDELMTEGTMLLEGVDIDIQFGVPLDAADELDEPVMQQLVNGSIISSFTDRPEVMRVLHKKAGRMMQTYMERIYSGTTINHDHLFASFLRRRSFRPFLGSELARSVYLVSDYLQQDKNLEKNLHSSLKGSQLHLLVDDRYDKQKNFFDLALSTECLVSDQQRYKKNEPFWQRTPLFHKARIENPTEVMANEIEPLEILQSYIRRVSWLPDLPTRLIIARRLYCQDLQKYDNERENSGEQVEFDYQIGRPFLFPAFSRKVGVVFVHSYLSAPAEVKQCARLLRKQGAWVYGIRLPGHGTTPETLAGLTWEDWRETVERGYTLINAICRNVILVGFSAGGMLALELASRLDSLAGVVAICPPNELQDYSKRFMPPIHIWNRLLARWKGDMMRDKFVEFEPEIKKINYHRNPVAGVNEVGKLLDTCREQLPDLHHRALIISADKDQVIGENGGQDVYERIGSRTKEHMRVSSERHNIIYGPGTERIQTIIASFVKDCLQ